MRNASVMRRGTVGIMLVLILVLVGGLFQTSPAMAASPQTITLITGNGAITDIDPIHEWSMDEGAHWQQAHVIATNGAWAAPISGTKWINCGPTDACGVGTSSVAKNTWFRTTFVLPAGFSSPSLNISLHADNAARVYLNGVPIFQHACFVNLATCTGGEFNDPPETFSTSIAALFQAGSNTLLIHRLDSGGVSGLDYKAVVTYTPSELLQDSVNAIEAKLDSRLNDTITSRATQTSVDAVQTSVNTKASQASVNAIEAKLDASLDAKVSSRATQTSVDAVQTSVNTKASQTSVNAIEAKLDASLDAKVSSRATQTSVDAVQTSVNTKASQASVNAIEAKLDASLDAKVSSRATQASLDSHVADIKTLVNNRATQIDNALNAVEAKLDARLDATVSSRATQASLNTHDTDIKARADAIDTALAKLETKADKIEGKLDSHAIQTAQTADLFGALVTYVVDHITVQLQVVEVKDKERWLVSASESGAPASGVSFKVLAIAAQDKKPAVITDVTANTVVAEVSAGLYDVKVSLPKGVKDVKMFQFNVSHTHTGTPLGTVVHAGSSLFSRQDNRNLEN